MDEAVKMQFRTEGQPAFPVETKENDDSSDSSAETQTTTDQTQSQEGDNSGAGGKDDGAPGSRDGKSGLNNPTVERWQEREADWNKRFNTQEERHTSELAKIREDLDKALNGNKQTSALPDKVPAWFGGDEQAWGEFQEWNKNLIKQAQDGAVQHLTTKQADEQKRIDDATNYFRSQVEALEADKELNPDGQKIDRNKLLKTAQDFDLVTSTGQWNWRAAFQMMRNMSPKGKNTEDRKKLADMSSTEKQADGKGPQPMTADDFKKPGARPW